jgi:hypothetical protein
MRKAVAHRDRQPVRVTAGRRRILIRLWPDGRSHPVALHASQRKAYADQFIAVATGQAAPGPPA